MPEISVQGVKVVHGYGSVPKTLFQKEGVLHFSSLRDSADEQTIADILACILNKVPVQRSRAALDRIYMSGTRDATKFEGLLSSYGEDDLRRDFLTVFDRIQVTCDHIKDEMFNHLFPEGSIIMKYRQFSASSLLLYYSPNTTPNLSSPPPFLPSSSSPSPPLLPPLLSSSPPLPLPPPLPLSPPSPLPSSPPPPSPPPPSSPSLPPPPLPPPPPFLLPRSFLPFTN